jgi:hypothetical protein
MDPTTNLILNYLSLPFGEKVKVYRENTALLKANGFSFWPKYEQVKEDSDTKIIYIHNKTVGGQKERYYCSHPHLTERRKDGRPKGCNASVDVHLESGQIEVLSRAHVCIFSLSPAARKDLNYTAGTFISAQVLSKEEILKKREILSKMIHDNRLSSPLEIVDSISLLAHDEKSLFDNEPPSDIAAAISKLKYSNKIEDSKAVFEIKDYSYKLNKNDLGAYCKDFDVSDNGSQVTFGIKSNMFFAYDLNCEFSFDANFKVPKSHYAC